MRIQEVNEVLNESKIMRHNNGGDTAGMGGSRGLMNRLPAVMKDWRFHAVVAGAITAGVTMFKLAHDRHMPKFL